MCMDGGTMMQTGMMNSWMGFGWFGMLLVFLFWIALFSLIVLANYYLWNKIQKEFRK